MVGLEVPPGQIDGHLRRHLPGEPDDALVAQGVLVVGERRVLDRLVEAGVLA
jgi:hypothetical protein